MGDSRPLTWRRRPTGIRRDDETGERIRAAALAEFEEFGLRRASLDDVARRAGVSRTTIYRRFGSKDALLGAVVIGENARFFELLDEAVDPDASTEERFVEGFAFAVLYWREHTLFKRILHAEPETFLPFLTTQAGDRLQLFAGLLARRMENERRSRGVAPRDIDAAAEMLIRVIVSFLIIPDTQFRLGTRAEARRFARRFILPALGLTGKQ
jgi:AcrR family transcriptional regulator